MPSLFNEPYKLPGKILPNGSIDLIIKVTPKASQTQIQDLIPDGRGETFLKMSVAAPPENNKANEALLLFWIKNLKPSSVTLCSGHKTRQKRIRIEGITEHDMELFIKKNLHVNPS